MLRRILCLRQPVEGRRPPGWLAVLAMFLLLGCGGNGSQGGVPPADAGLDPDVADAGDVPDGADVTGDTTPIPLPPTLLPGNADSGFRLEYDAFPFANFGGDFAGTGLTVEIMADMFGPETVCVDGVVPCVPTAAAERWRQSVQVTLDAGRSEGMAAAALLFFLGVLDPVDYGAEDAARMQLAGNAALQSLLARLSAAQRVAEVAALQRPMDARQAARFLEEVLQPGQTEAWRMGMAIREAEGFRAGHAMVPISLERVSGEARYVIRAWDPNVPQQEVFVELDLEANTWRYDGTVEAELPMVYEGQGEDGNLLYFAPVSGRMDRLPSPFAADSSRVQIAVNGPLEMMADFGEGNRAGYMDGAPVSAGDAFAIPGLSACICDSAMRTSTVVHAPAAGAGRETRVEVAGSGDAYVATSTWSTQVTVPEGGEGGTLTVSPDGQGVQWTSSDGAGASEGGVTTITTVVQTSAGTIEVTVRVSEGADLNIRTDDLGQVTVGVDGAPAGSAVQVVIREVAPDGSTRTSTQSGSADGSGDRTVSFRPGTGAFVGTIPPEPCENGVLDGRETDVDCGGDACFDRCVAGLRCGGDGDCVAGTICSAGGRCIEPGCFDGRRNGAETDVDCGGPCTRCAATQRCESTSDCRRNATCLNSRCEAAVPVMVRVNGLRLPTETVIVQALVDGLQRQAFVRPPSLDVTSTTIQMGQGGGYTDTRVISAPAGAVCVVVGPTANDDERATVFLIQVNCTWTQSVLIPRVSGMGDALCAPSDDSSNLLRVTVDGVASDLRLRPGVLPDILPTRLFNTNWSAAIVERPDLAFYASVGRWAVQQCDITSAAGGDHRATAAVQALQVACQCRYCNGTEEECTRWARVIGAIPRLGAASTCREDSECESRNCECGEESGRCVTRAGRCGGPVQFYGTPIVAAPFGSGRAPDPSGTFTVPDACPAVTIHAWGAGGGGVSDSREGVVAGRAGGAGGLVVGRVAVQPGNVLSVYVGGAGGTGSRTAGGAGGVGYATTDAGATNTSGGSGGAVVSRGLSGGGGGAATGVMWPAGGLVAAGGGGSQSSNNPGRPGGVTLTTGWFARLGESTTAGAFGGGGGGNFGGRAGDGTLAASGGAARPAPRGLRNESGTGIGADGAQTFAVPPRAGTIALDQCGAQAQAAGPLRVGAPASGGRTLDQPAGHGCVSIRCVDPSNFDGIRGFDGQSCTANSDCTSAWCGCGASSGSCTGDSGVCRQAPRADGAACTAHVDCAIGFCRCPPNSGSCVGDSGVCREDVRPEGEACERNDDCASDWCGCGTRSGNCVGIGGVCRPSPAALGSACTLHDGCSSAWCDCGAESGSCTGDSGVCSRAPAGLGTACTANRDCASRWCGCGAASGGCEGDSGVCAALPTSGIPGQACTLDSECISENCVCGRTSGECTGNTGRCGGRRLVVSEAVRGGLVPSATFQVPAECPSVHMSAWGAAGGASSEEFGFVSSPGGAGAFVRGTLAVREGDVVTVWIGGGGPFGVATGPNGGLGATCGGGAGNGGAGNAIDLFGDSGGSGGGLSSVCLRGSRSVDVAVPAGAGAAVDGTVSGVGGGDPSGGASDSQGESARFGTNGGGGGGGQPGGLGSSNRGEDALGGAVGTLPADLELEVSSAADGASPEGTELADFALCPEELASPAGTGVEGQPGGSGCVVLRCVAP